MTEYDLQYSKLPVTEYYTCQRCSKKFNQTEIDSHSCFRKRNAAYQKEITMNDSTFYHNL